MKEHEYKDRLQAFKNSCRVYEQEQKVLENARLLNVESDERLTAYLKEDVESVNRMFEIIKELCGTSIAVMIWQLFVEGKTQAAIAHQFGITRRQLQYCVNKYMHEVFEEELIRAAR